MRALQRWAPVNSQGVQQTVPIAKVDVQTVAAGYRASGVIGSSVLNEARETIGKIDDLLVTRDGKEPYAVLSIGGFLGMGARMVVVRYDSLRFDPDNKIVLPGGTTGESGEGFRWRLGWRGSHRPMRRPFADLAGIAFQAGVSAD